ncbi:NADH-quinone oxidoreductase subunit J family protein [Moheibacter lacus]|uniref:NADH-quinone oxidoreductase subunit J n=1 Tax=Moheibacter lacus TaxID=2745851 RepID=A0A838ZLB8_9FLAO|nr:NADH-quinone oxidoreductase subunit J [Moheibacter lacus]MBA5629264.1 NADH-quinone oxidoreductase subunit J [Moheibacter lacus]
METAEILFFVLASLTILSGLLTVTTKNPVYSILYLIITFFSISGHYVLLNAQFLAVVNIIVYAGAIMVLFLFVVMLMNLNKEDKNFSKPFIILSGTIVSILFFALTVGIFLKSDIKENNQTLLAKSDIGLTESIGTALYSDYVIPFELASILFMGAMIGAVLLSKRTEDLHVKD